MSDPHDVDIPKARSALVSLLNQEFVNHSLGAFDPYEFGAAVSPLVNAFAALTILEKETHPAPRLGEASRPDD